MRAERGGWGPTCDQILFAVSLQRHPAEGGGGSRVDGVDVLVGTLEHLQRERREGSDPRWSQRRDREASRTTDLQLLDAELDLLDGISVDVVAHVHLLPLQQLRPNNCRDTQTPRSAFKGLLLGPHLYLIAAPAQRLFWHSGLGCGFGREERACARCCERLLGCNQRQECEPLPAREEASQQIFKKEELEFSSRKAEASRRPPLRPDL